MRTMKARRFISWGGKKKGESLYYPKRVDKRVERTAGSHRTENERAILRWGKTNPRRGGGSRLEITVVEAGVELEYPDYPEQVPDRQALIQLRHAGGGDEGSSTQESPQG